MNIKHNFMRIKLNRVVSFAFFIFLSLSILGQSKYVNLVLGKLIYIPDSLGNVIPDFSRVGYHMGNKQIPDVKVVKTIYAPVEGNSQKLIQDAINEVEAMPVDNDGFRGAILLKKGVYKVPGTLKITKSGVVIRGEGDSDEGTVIIATDSINRSLLDISGKGRDTEIEGSRTRISDKYVPVGSFSFSVEEPGKYKVGDNIIVYRPATKEWISDIKMDQIVERPGTRQWTTDGYNLKFERTITRIEGNKIYIDNPIVMAMEEKYGGGFIYKYSFEGRISETGVEYIYFKSEYKSETDEKHGWIAVDFGSVENAWVRNVTSRFFGYSCVYMSNQSKFITVTDSRCFDAKSQITGGRRYSFNLNGQMILVKNCESTEGRHDYVTGARVSGPNVFYNCKASKTHSDVGPHHRWATGTLYDNVETDGVINIQDRGRMGSGHGWAGANQVLWNCKAKKACVQNPWVSAKNYSIGLVGEKYPGAFTDRLDGEWESHNKHVQPESLYMMQLKARK